MSPVFMVMVVSILTKVSEAKNSVNICDFSPQSESNLLPPLPYICFCKKKEDLSCPMPYVLWDVSRKSKEVKAAEKGPQAVVELM